MLKRVVPFYVESVFKKVINHKYDVHKTLHVDNHTRIVESSLNHDNRVIRLTGCGCELKMDFRLKKKHIHFLVIATKYLLKQCPSTELDPKA